MLAMRHRSPRGYQPVNTEDVDYDEDIHSIGNQLTNRSQKVIKANIIKSRNASGLYNIRLIQFYIFFNSGSFRWGCGGSFSISRLLDL